MWDAAQAQRWPMETRVLVDAALERGTVREVTTGEVEWVLEDALRWCIGYYYEWLYLASSPRPGFRFVYDEAALARMSESDRGTVNEWLRNADWVLSQELVRGIQHHEDERWLRVAESDPFYFEMPSERPPPKPDPSPKSRVPRFVRERGARLDGR